MEKVLPSVSKQLAENYKQIEQKYLKNARASLPDNLNYTG